MFVSQMLADRFIASRRKIGKQAPLLEIKVAFDLLLDTCRKIGKQAFDVILAAIGTGAAVRAEELLQALHQGDRGPVFLM
jgi:hypothetical protein